MKYSEFENRINAVLPARYQHSYFLPSVPEQYRAVFVEALEHGGDINEIMDLIHSSKDVTVALTNYIKQKTRDNVSEIKE